MASRSSRRPKPRRTFQAGEKRSPSGAGRDAPAVRASERAGWAVLRRRAVGGGVLGRPFVRYLTVFAAVALGLFAVYWLAEATGRFEVVNRANAVLATAVLELLGANPLRGGTSVALAGGAMQVVSECSAIYVAILFTAAVLAFPTTWRARGRGLAIGLPLLFAVNVVRIVTLGLVLEHRAALLPFVHEYLWQVLFVLVVAALYLAWIEWVVPHERSRALA